MIVFTCSGSALSSFLCSSRGSPRLAHFSPHRLIVSAYRLPTQMPVAIATPPPSPLADSLRDCVLRYSRATPSQANRAKQRKYWTGRNTYALPIYNSTMELQQQRSRQRCRSIRRRRRRHRLLSACNKIWPNSWSFATFSVSTALFTQIPVAPHTQTPDLPCSPSWPTCGH